MECTGQKNQENHHHSQLKPKTELEKTCKPRKTPKPKTAVLKCQNRKTEPKLGQIREIENGPLFEGTLYFLC